MRRGVALNALGWGLPALVALASVPALTRTLGPERFGLLALAWAAVAAFGQLDLGLGRATTFLVASKRLPRDAVVAGSGAWVWLLFGPVALLGYALAPWLAASVLDVPAELQDEARGVLRILALTVPVAVHGVVLRAALEGEARWGLANALRAPMGLVTWGGPWLVSLVSSDPRHLALVIAAGRTAYWLAQWGALGWATRAPAMRPLLEAGGWMTVSGIVAPVLNLADRALVPALVPIAAVGWYVGAGEAASKLWIVATVLQPVLFQAMTAARSRGEPLGPLLRRGLLYTLGPLSLPVLVVIVSGEPLLAMWLGPSFAPAAATVFVWFTLAVTANSLALVAYAALHADGQAKPVAVLHLVQLPVYVALLAWAALHWGALGAAAAWSLRLVLDAAALWWLLHRTGARASH
ncbi:MAG: oligosaccharide flippase family protein [Gemmatimonadaceae bacterium]|nr:oligosaccharide flippase family protein [Gemmatimonadaceae bacterium]MCW5825399.1 oligosaccharide flippase family protein [Gemmatimonadaceae bacterium]